MVPASAHHDARNVAQMRRGRAMTLRNVVGVAGTTIGLLLPLAAPAQVTGPAGGSQPHATIQPSLAINYLVRTDGTFFHLGDIGLFGGNFAPEGWLPADGRLLQIDQHQTLFSVIGTTYGGDGQTTFQLPDLRGRAPIGMGTGAGLTTRMLGETTGSESVTLTTAQLPPHSHTLPLPLGVTGATGAGQPYNNMQPSLALNYAIALQGVFPSPNTGSFGSDPILAFLELTSRADLPNGFASAQGQLLPINQNQALFSILGTTYGGNGQTTFALPDLRGRAVAGEGAGLGLTPLLLGESSGTESLSLTQSQLPAHDHTLPPSSDSTGITGAGDPLTSMQPYLGLNYLIALEGIFPSRYQDEETGFGGSDEGPFVGEIGLFAGNFAPDGWAFAAGQLLSISQNTALFALLGTTYGGDGETTFALPDLRGRLGLGEGEGLGLTPWLLGQMDGAESLALTVAQMPSHTHAYSTPTGTVPEPGTVVLFSIALAGLGFARRRALN
jgi:microcystin-dependent protein